MAKCFLIGPIGGEDSDERIHSDWVCDGIVKPVLENEPFDYKVTRADEIAEPGLITDQIIISIDEADLIVADLTSHNPNAFYELGIAHVMRKPVIHMIDKGQTPPFDIKDFRTVFFSRVRHSDVKKAMDDLKAQVAAVRDPKFVVSNPVTKALGHRELAASGDTKDKLIADLLDKVSRIDSRINQIEYLGEYERLVHGCTTFASGTHVPIGSGGIPVGNALGGLFGAPPNYPPPPSSTLLGEIGKGLAKRAKSNKGKAKKDKSDEGS